MRKAIYIMASMAIVSSIGFGIYNYNGDGNPTIGTEQNSITYKIASAQAKMPYFEDLNSLESYSEVIVIGHVTGQQGTYQVKTGSGTVIEELGKTPFQIDKVFKGNNIVKEQTSITVMEDGRVEDGKYQTLEGYIKMNESDRYLLFLRKTGDNTYAINGSYQGKFNIDNPGNVSQFKGNSISLEQLKDVEYIGEFTDHFNELKEEAIHKYKI